MERGKRDLSMAKAVIRGQLLRVELAMTACPEAYREDRQDLCIRWPGRRAQGPGENPAIRCKAGYL